MLSITFRYCVITAMSVAVISWQQTKLTCASTIAFDAAADVAYAASTAGAWQGLNATIGENPIGNDNGGFGFNAWDFAGGFHQPAWSPYGNLNHFIDGVDFPASSFNDLGQPAFGLTNGNRPFFGYTSRATRTFAPLEVGDTLSLNFDNPLLQPLDPFSASGFLFRLNTGGGPVIDNDPIPGVHERLGIFTTSNFNGGRWYVTDSQAFTDTGVADSDTDSGAMLQFTLTDTENYTVELLSLDGQQVFYSRSATLNNAGEGAIDTLEITLFGNGSGDGMANSSPTGQREFFFNNMQIKAQDTGVPGDFDLDGDADGVDFLWWQRGESPIPLSSSDLVEWETHFGATVPSSGVVSAVPEPSLYFLAAFSVGIMLSRRNRAQD